MARRITPRSEDYNQWYVDVVLQAKLADYAPVKGCMVIRPNGYALWENIQQTLDAMFKATGHVNAYFPLLIPESYLKKEEEHIEGFKPELAVVTHGGGKKLEEPLVIRPTSETIIWPMFKKWIQSYRDLPLLINQWANVVRWEMRTRLFLRTLEFLWQEGHTAHATFEEAEEEALTILELYRSFAEEWMAMPVVTGLKTERERFAGALKTYTIEAMMQDRRALQAGTSHNLGQNFARAFDVTFQNADGDLEHVWATSWGVSTRLIGALVMAHSDDQRLVLPPKLAPNQVVVVPIFKGEAERARVLEAAETLRAALGGDVRCHVDSREEHTPGWKFNEWELLGVPVRVEVGPRDLERREVVLARRDTGEKASVPQEGAAQAIRDLLEAVQANLLSSALSFRDQHTHLLDDFEKLKEINEAGGGFFSIHWCGAEPCEDRLQEETKVTIRAIPLDGEAEAGRCILCNQSSTQRVVAARAY
ncbi:MAG: proline--tRNA ligase [Nitrospinae bacterium]|nr:proline--tRNA ligase [Nitrospinota bacterium]